MIRDLLYYFKYRLQDKRQQRKEQKQKEQESEQLALKPVHKRFIFQKISIVIAAVLWLIAAGNVLWGQRDVQGQDKIISAFSSTSYLDMNAGISSYGKYGNVPLTDSAKTIILEKIAEKIGINHYVIEDTMEDNNSVKTLSQNSKNGDVICKFITIAQHAGGQDVSSEHYIYVGISLKNNIDSAFTYEKMVEEIMKDMEIDTTVTVNLKGEVQGKLGTDVKDALTEQMLSKMNAKVQAENKTDDAYTIYAYDSDIKNYITIGSNKVNINVSMYYDEEQNVTTVYFSTPINNEDY